MIAVLNVALIRAGSCRRASSCARAWRRSSRSGVSYGLYLYHWPVFLWLDETRTGLSGAGLLVVWVVVMGVLAALSYHLLECPIRYRRFLVRRRQFVGVIGASLACVVVLAEPRRSRNPLDAVRRTFVHADPGSARQRGDRRARTRRTVARDGDRRLDRPCPRARVWPPGPIWTSSMRRDRGVRSCTRRPHVDSPATRRVT